MLPTTSTGRPEQPPYNNSNNKSMQDVSLMDSSTFLHNNTHNRSGATTPPNTNSHSEIARLFQACNEGHVVVPVVALFHEQSAWEVLLEWIVDKKRQGQNTKLKRLVTYQDTKTRRTFLHIACVHQAPLPVLETLLELAEDAYTSIRIIQDCHGMTPLHLACQHGVSVDHIRLIATGFTLTMSDEWGRTPLHVVMEYAMNPEAASMMQFLLNHSSTLNAIEQRFCRTKRGHVPLECLANVRLHHLERHVLDCFDVYIRALHDSNNHTLFTQMDSTSQASLSAVELEFHIRHNHPDPDLFPVLGELPQFVQQHAAQHPLVQQMINQRFCDSDMTFLFLLRLISRLIMVISFQLYWRHHLSGDSQESNIQWQVAFVFLLLSTGTLLVTDLYVLAIRIWKGKCFSTWQCSPFELVNVLLITGVLLFAILTVPAGGSTIMMTPHTFRILSIVGSLILLLAWSGILLSLRLVSKDFSSLLDGLWSLGQQLLAFGLILTIVIFAFAQMFYLTTMELVTLQDEVGNNVLQQVTCPSPNDNTGSGSPFCTSFSSSLLTIYAMTVGEVDIWGDGNSTTTTDQTFVILLYVVFIYVTVLLLAQILAFIIGNDVWRNGHHNADLYFWSNRIRFLADMEALARVCCCCCTSDEMAEKSWLALSSIFSDHQLGALSPSFWFIMVLRLNVATVMIVWGILGGITLGFAWPPQVRKYLFWAPIHQKETTSSAAAAASSILDPIFPSTKPSSMLPVGLSGGSSDQEDILLVKADVNRLGDRIMTLETKVDKVLALLEREWFHDEETTVASLRDQHRGYHGNYSRRGSMDSMASVGEHHHYPQQNSRRASMASMASMNSYG